MAVPIWNENSKSFLVQAKTDVKDRIDVVVGDDQDPDNFQPQMKMTKRGSKEWKEKISMGRKGKPSWHAGKTGVYNKETLEKMRQAKLGRKLTEEHKRKVSEALKGKIPKNLSQLDNSGANSHWWRGGITPENERQRKTKEFRHWRKSVYERDEYKCQKCGENTHDLHPHHIQNFAEYEELRFETANGITFCEKCHRKFHSKYGMTGNNYTQVTEYLGV